MHRYNDEYYDSRDGRDDYCDCDDRYLRYEDDEREGREERGNQKRRKSRKKKDSEELTPEERSRQLGKRGEEAAVHFLVRRGYDILEQNWTCYAGEADIIAEDGQCLVFVEVKTRSDCRKGFPAEAVTAAKREKYEKIALAYLSEYEVADVPVRFDVVSIVVVGPDRALVRHHINAFSAGALS